MTLRIIQRRALRLPTMGKGVGPHQGPVPRPDRKAGCHPGGPGREIRKPRRVILKPGDTVGFALLGLGLSWSLHSFLPSDASLLEHSMSILSLSHIVFWKHRSTAGVIFSPQDIPYLESRPYPLNMVF